MCLNTTVSGVTVRQVCWNPALPAMFSVTFGDGSLAMYTLKVPYLFTCRVVPRGPCRASQGTFGPGWSRSHLSYLIGPLSLQWFALSSLSVSCTLSGKHFWPHFSSQKVFCSSFQFLTLKKFHLISSLPWSLKFERVRRIFLVALWPSAAFSNQQE